MNSELSGALRALALPDILEYLKISGKTGILTIDHGEVEKRLHVKDGNVVFASSNLPEDRLGNLLLRMGTITQVQLDESSDLMRQVSGKRHGRVLVETGALTPQGLWDAVRMQIKEIVYSLFDWEDGRFSFDERALPKEEAITVDVEITELVVEGIRRIRNRKCLDSWAPNRDVVLELHAPEPSPVAFVEYEKHVMGLLDGERTVEGVIEASEIGAFETLKVLYMLSAIGYVSPKRGTVQAAAPHPVAGAPAKAGLDESDVAALLGSYNAIYSYLHRCLLREAGPIATALFEKYFAELQERDDDGFFEGLYPGADGAIPERPLLDNLRKKKGGVVRPAIEARLQSLVDRQMRGLRRVLGEDHARRAESALQGLRMKL